VINTMLSLNNKAHYLPLLKHSTFQSLINANTRFTKRILLVIRLHRLNTTVPLFDFLINEMGFLPDRMIVGGKSYSDCPSVVEEIRTMGAECLPNSEQLVYGGFETAYCRDIHWQWIKAKKIINTALSHNEPIKGIIVFDEGGHLLTSTPPDICRTYPIIGIEQTSAGFFNQEVCGLPFPVIELARSAAKTQVESPIIAEEVAKSVMKIKALPLSAKYAVIGYGNVGKAVANKLTELGFDVYIYDKKRVIPNTCKGTVIDDLANLVVICHYFFSCSGADITVSDEFDQALTDKVLISCSSEDKEFKTLLGEYQKQAKQKNQSISISSDLHYTNKSGAIITIMRGGCPINFNGQFEMLSPNDIQLTRALQLASIERGIALKVIQR